MEGTGGSFISQMLRALIDLRHYHRRSLSATYAPQVLCSTFSAEALRQLCHPHYGLDDSVGCTLFRRNMNDVYLLSTGNQYFCFKVYQAKWRTREAIMAEIHALRHIAAKGVEVALPIPRTDGSWITDIDAPEGWRGAVLFQWASGETPKYSDPAHAAQFGRQLARLHTASDDLASNSSRPQMSVRNLLDESLTSIRRRLRSSGALNKRFEVVAERSRARLYPAEAALKDWGLCHGDVLVDNACIQGNRFVLFDFDWCGFGWRVFDLATYRWAARMHNAEAVAWRPFIEAYLQVRPSAALSLESVRSFMLVRQLWHMAQCIRSAAIVGHVLLNDVFLEKLLSQCEQIETENEYTDAA